MDGWWDIFPPVACFDPGGSIYGDRWTDGRKTEDDEPWKGFTFLRLRPVLETLAHNRVMYRHITLGLTINLGVWRLFFGLKGSECAAHPVDWPVEALLNLRQLCEFSHTPWGTTSSWLAVIPCISKYCNIIDVAILGTFCNQLGILTKGKDCTGNVNLSTCSAAAKPHMQQAYIPTTAVQDKPGISCSRWEHVWAMVHERSPVVKDEVEKKAMVH